MQAPIRRIRQKHMKDKSRYPKLSYFLFSWVKLARRSLHIRSLWKLRYPEYFRVKCYNGIFRALADYSMNIKKYQQAFLAPLPGTSLTTPFLVIVLRSVNKHFWRRCRETDVVVIFEPSLPVYLFFYLFSSFVLFHGFPFYQSILCSQGRVLRAT